MKILIFKKTASIAKVIFRSCWRSYLMLAGLVGWSDAVMRIGFGANTQDFAEQGYA